ncbi:hypothetical protein GBA65_06600 [Rubrobacter marinus]|uniref:Uncharacterized protein n=1 Tax=Rubrobacter marinus TaxID=2653852 RepID=A0A6G8PVK3_9ACTN|nr:hypothetical protein GBA65_06600 [Rubrobacter marinus]
MRPSRGGRGRAELGELVYEHDPLPARRRRPGGAGVVRRPDLVRRERDDAAGETDGYAVSDHLRAIHAHAGPVVTDVLVHAGALSDELVRRYEAEGASPVAVDGEKVRAMGVRVREADLISREAAARLSLRHDADRLAEEVREVALVRL